MESKLDECKEKCDDNADFRERFDIYIEKKSIKDVYDQIKDDIELMLYNNRELVKKKS